MHDRRPVIGLIGLHKSEGRAGNVGLMRAERGDDAARQHGFSGTERARQGHDVTRAKQAGKAKAQPRGRGRALQCQV